jgi:hypothetical protein
MLPATSVKAVPITVKIALGVLDPPAILVQPVTGEVEAGLGASGGLRSSVFGRHPSIPRPANVKPITRPPTSTAMPAAAPANRMRFQCIGLRGQASVRSALRLSSIMQPARAGRARISMSKNQTTMPATRAETRPAVPDTSRRFATRWTGCSRPLLARLWASVVPANV